MSVTPDLPIETYLDAFGNRCMRIALPRGTETVRLTLDTTCYFSGETDPQAPDAIAHPVHELPASTLQFLLASRYCPVDSELMQLAWDTFGGIEGGWARVQAVCDFVHDRIRFDYQQADAQRTAVGGYHDRVGVCRDFAHLAITLCRCLNIPARYVNGYLGDIGIDPLPPPMDFSAWFEVYLGGRWYAFDARHNIPRMARVNIAHGRDAADVPITMVFGSHTVRRFDVVAEQVDEAEVSS